jgi:PAS domain S-box-containing protein
MNKGHINSPLQFLHFDVDPDFANRVRLALENGGIDCHIGRVETRTAFLTAIKRHEFDLILADCSPPLFEGVATLKIAQKKCPETPFIFICGDLGRDLAIEGVKNGATDYVLKHELERLAPSVRHAMREVDESTLRKIAERSLRTLEEKFRGLFENILDGVYQTSPNDKILLANPAMISMLGYDTEHELLDADFANKLLSDPEKRKPWLKKLENAHEPQSSEQILRCKDGRLINVLENARAVFDKRARVLYYEGTFTDISELKGTEEALQETEDKFRILVENYNDALYVLQDRRFVFVNPKFVDLLEYPFDELSARDFDTRKLFARKSEEGETVFDSDSHEEFRFNFMALSKSGKEIDFEVKVSPILWDGRPAVLGSMRDVTERNRLEGHLRQTSKLAAIGSLAGGIAHDFNNLLMIINGFSEFALNSPDTPPALRDDLEEVQNAGKRAADLTRQLLAFSRQQVLQLQALDLNQIVKGMNKLLRRVIGEDIKLELALAENLGSVQADFSQIENVIINLAVNARDAMPRGGVLAIQTANVELDEHHANEHTSVIPGRYVQLTVSDNGAGISKEVREKIFEPFFTTKEKGEGTGLGLSTVYGIVKQCGGNIWVYSELGYGTTFKIYFPMIGVEPEEVSRKSEYCRTPAGTEAILVVEDEESARKFAAKSLQRQGYNVLVAGNGKEALRIVGRSPNCIDLLLTDVIMPGMSGRQLSKKLVKELPKIKTLYMSGYLDDTIVHYGILEPGINFIQKPYSSLELARKVRQVLDSS